MFDSNEPSIPFPLEALSENSELEEVVFSHPTKGSPLDASRLPARLRSGAIEVYTNWIFNLQQADPHKRERGGRVYVRVSSDGAVEPVFDQNPQVADLHSPDLLETPRFGHEDWEDKIPRADVHPHWGDKWSPIIPDFKSFLSDFYFTKVFKTPQPNMADIIATPSYNLLFITTAQSDCSDRSMVFSFLENLRAITREISLQSVAESVLFKDTCLSAGISYDKIEREILSAEADLFEGHHFAFIFTRYILQEVARLCNIGFYASLKDGEYRLVNREMPNDPNLAFRTRVKLTVEQNGASSLPYANFLDNIDPKLEALSTINRVRALGLVIPTRGLII